MSEKNYKVEIFNTDGQMIAEQTVKTEFDAKRIVEIYPPSCQCRITDSSSENVVEEDFSISRLAELM